MVEAVFAMITLWGAPDAVASPASHITDRLPQTLDAAGLSASTKLDDKPLVTFCASGHGSLDDFTFARAADVARVASLPACTSSFDAVQRQAMNGTIGPFGIVQSGDEWFEPSAFYAPPRAFFFEPSKAAAPSVFSAPAAFAGITRLSGSLGGAAGLARGVRVSAPAARASQVAKHPR